MGKWGTHEVNLCNVLIKSLKEKGYKFCYIKDNLEVFKKYEESKTETKTEPEPETETGDQVCPDKQFEFITDKGDKINGNIFHLVRDSTSGCRETSWFIVCPSIQSNVDTVVVEDL